MELLDSRRLTGPNLLWDRPAAVIDVRFGDFDRERLVAEWERQIRRMLDALGWGAVATRVYHHGERPEDGASLAIGAPRDALYAATEVNEWAWEAACTVITGGDTPALEADARRLRDRIEQERSPALLALHAAALARDLSCLIDEDYVSVGLGAGSRTWPATEPPDPEKLDWASLYRIPVGLVTGTNGKTTSVRLAAAIARAAVHVTGLSSTNWIAVDGEIVDRGDYSGPGGARTVLRDPRVEIAILETARGGLLRRGLAVERADAALITNVAEDHLGEFGLPDLASLARLKWVVTRALGRHGRLVLNADDPLLVELARDAKAPITWFSLDPTNPVLAVHRVRGGDACSVEDDELVLWQDGHRQTLLGVAEIPLTLGGAAVHNIANALGVVGLCAALGLPADAIINGLRNTDRAANPGRGNLFEINGARAIVDFAHNPHGMHAVFEMARRLPAQRRLLLIGQAGDRSDQAIREFARAAAAIHPDRIIIKELAHYARGRAKGEVAALLRDEFLSLGVAAQKLDYQEDEMVAVREALDWAREGDLLLLLTHENQDEVIEFLRGKQELSTEVPDSIRAARDRKSSPR